AEIDSVKGGNYEGISQKVQTILKESGLKVATQNYSYDSAGISYTGQNVYGIIQAPRGDATEAIVLVAAWKTIEEELNLNGVTLALSLARYFKRWSLWSKDIIFLITPDSRAGAQAWIDAYHDMHPPSVDPLPLKSGSLQGAVAFEYPFDHHFHSLHIVYDGVNGQLPNLDLFNIAVLISNGQMGIPTSLQRMYEHDDSYNERMQTMLRGMLTQGLGYSAGLHSSFIPYHIDAITLQTIGDGWQDEMALGRTIESIVRSLNNLLEHLHQSFFFYILMQSNRFVSIGTYLPSAMLIAGNFTIMAIALWLKSGTPLDLNSPDASKSKEVEAEVQAAANGAIAIERHMALPLTLTVGFHFLGFFFPLKIFNEIHQQHATAAFRVFSVLCTLIPIMLAVVVREKFHPTTQELALVKSFSLLLLGLFLSTLATLNFSLSLSIGLFCIPVTYVGYTESSSLNGVFRQFRTLRRCFRVLQLIALNLVSPTAVILLGSRYFDISIERVLTEAAFAWNVWGMWTQVAV
ncbi:Glycosyl phosphatidyl inositol protein transamidase complex subunit, partial [Ascosphaera pollenicola]